MFITQDVEQLKNLLQAIVELIWYLSLHSEKLKNCGASLPTFFNLLIKFNDPLHQIQHAVLLNLTSNVTTILEKSFVTHKSFKFLHNVFDILVESAVKYADYLQENLEVNMHNNKIETLPFITHEKLCKYSKNERSKIENISDKLLESDFYNPVALNDILPRNAAQNYKLLQKLKETGISTPNTVNFTMSYRPAVGGSVFFCLETGFC